MFREKNLAIVHGIGSPNSTRSHFDAQDYMESGTPFNKGTSSGWLNRAIGLSGHESTSPFKAVSLTSALPRSFYGEIPSLAISDLRDFAIQSKIILMPPVLQKVLKNYMIELRPIYCSKQEKKILRQSKCFAKLKRGQSKLPMPANILIHR